MGEVVGYADGKGGMHPGPGLAVKSKESGLIIGFTDGKGGVGGADTIRRMYRGKELEDVVNNRLDDYLASDPGLSGDARVGGVARGGGTPAPAPFTRTAELEHTVTKSWQNANRGRSGGLDPRAMEALLRKLGVSAYFEVSSTGDRINPKGDGLGIDYLVDDSGDIRLTFKWKA